MLHFTPPRRMPVYCCLLVAVLSLGPLTAADEPQPNILFIFADDQCFETVHAWGNDEIETPNLDRLCAAVSRFPTRTTWDPGAERSASPAARC